MEFATDIFAQFDKKWALLTAGNTQDFNTMTISWGGMGTLWNKPVVTAYVRTSRYTHDFMDREEYFTVSFFAEEYRQILGVLGSRSGREMDKIHESGLTVKPAGDSVTFAEAEVTILCRKIFMQRLEIDNIPDDVVATFYVGDAPHDMYIGEVIDVIR